MLRRISLILLTLVLSSCMSAGNKNRSVVQAPPKPVVVKQNPSFTEVRQKPDLRQVDVDTRFMIKRRCLDYQEKSIPAYWDCLRSELKTIGIVSSTKPPETKTQEFQSLLSSTLNQADRGNQTNFPSAPETIVPATPPDWSQIKGNKEGIKIRKEIVNKICEGFRNSGPRKYWACQKRQMDKIETYFKQTMAMGSLGEETTMLIVNFCEKEVTQAVRARYFVGQLFLGVLLDGAKTPPLDPKNPILTESEFESLFSCIGKQLQDIGK